MPLQNISWAKRLILRKVAMDFIKKHWGTIAAIGGTVAQFVDWNQVASFEHAHQFTAVGVILAVLLRVKQEKGFGA